MIHCSQYKEVLTNKTGISGRSERSLGHLKTVVANAVTAGLFEVHMFSGIVPAARLVKPLLVGTRVGR